MAKDIYGIEGIDMGNIVFYKLLEAAADQRVPFELLKETVHAALKLAI